MALIDLFEHNQAAYASAVTMLDEVGRAAIVHPTGTGKSFIAFKLCQEHSDRAVCWLSPSEYIFKTQLENLRKATGFQPENIRFFTYAKLMLLDEAAIAEIAPNYIILDEFHRCGAEFWGQGVHRLLNYFPEVPVLGLSATSVRYLDNQRDMADELFGGHIASEMTLGEAIVRGILHPPKYVLSVYAYQRDLERYEKRIQNAQSPIVRDAARRYLEALRRALEKADGLDRIFARHIPDRHGKYILFCASHQHMQEMIRQVPNWFGSVDESPHIYQAYSSDPATSKAFQAFKEDNSQHLKLLFCIDMLNEGIHVDDVSGVVLFRPTVSPIVYKQQIGRAMSANQEKSVVIFDIVNNISNLYSIGAIEEEIREAVEYYRSEGDGEDIVQERFTVIDEVRDCKRLFDALENALVASWDYMYLEAKAYYEENGDLVVPAHYVTASGYGLGCWVVTQRGIYNGTHEGSLTEQQVEKLNAIGMCWLTANERIWQEQYAQAKVHFEKTGGLLPPYKSTSLKTWLYRQRKKHSENSLSQEKVELLKTLGIQWETEDPWEDMFRQAAIYYGKHGNLDIPATYVTEQGAPLGRWYRRCVTEARRGELSQERRKRLESIGFDQEPVKARAWMKYYAEAQKYQEKNGNLNVHADFITESGLRLGTWISSQRYSRSLGRLSERRIELLDAIGMDWQRFDGRWNEGYGHLQDYVRSSGSADVPYDYISADGYRLGNWVNTQRNKKEKLDPQKAARLDALGFIWKVTDAAWDNACTALESYQKQFGNLDVPEDYVTSQGIRLRAWVNNQRTRFKTGKLRPEQISRLENLGFVWSLQEQGWERMFVCARRYYEVNGNLEVPKTYLTDMGVNLYAWLAAQRKSLRTGKLPAHKAERLWAIGLPRL